MITSGFLVNTLGVIAGSAIGMAIRGGLKERFETILMQAIGLCVIFIGAAGALTGLMKVADESTGTLETIGTMVLIVSCVAGALLGEFLNIELRMEQLGRWIKKHVRSEKEDKHFVEGFVTSSLLICVGAMAIVGSLEDGLAGDASILYAKTAIDFVIVILFASTYGLGVMFSAFPILVYEGLLTAFARLLQPLFTQALIADMSFVGSVLIFAVGINIAFGKRFKVGNLLPAVFMPILIQLIGNLF